MEPIHILGSGALGLLWASSIRAAFPSYPLAVLFRSRHKTLLGSATREVPVCTMAKGRPIMSVVPIQYIGDERKATIKNLVVATKAHQAMDAVEGVISRLTNSNPRIIFLCNGSLDARENVRTLLRENNVADPLFVMCSTTQGVYQDEPDEDMLHLTQVGLGRTYIGGVPEIAELWDRSSLNAQCIDPIEMEVLLWRKHAANCFCNPLTAIWKVSNADLLNQPRSSSLRKQIVAEVSEVAQTLNPGLKERLAPNELDAFVEQTIQENLANKSSMYHDLQSGRKTEVDNLNGFIVRQGSALGITTPANLELLESIHDHESRTKSRREQT